MSSQGNNSLKSKEHDFLFLIDNSPAMIWMSHADHSCAYKNKQYKEFIGQIDDSKPLSLLDHVHHEDLSKLMSIVEKAKESKEAFSFECRLKHSGGEYRWVTVSGNCILDEKEVFQGFTGTIVDIHERRVFESELEYQREYIYSLLMRSPAAIAVLSCPELKFLMVNPAYKMMFNSDRQEGKKLSEVLPKRAEKFVQILENVCKTGVRYEGHEVPIHVSDDHEPARYFNFVYEPIKNAMGTTEKIMVFTYEVTEQINARQKLEQMAEQAKVASVAKSQFLANMSHEIRTPLGAMLGFTELLKNYKVNEKERKHYLETISRNGRALNRIIDDILDLSKVEAGHIEFESVPVSISKLLNETVDLFREQAIMKGIQLLYSMESTDVTILSDAIRLRQILVNIIGNAIKFTDSGRVEISAKIENMESRQCKIMISVLDTGPGLTAEQKSGLFQPFSQVDTSYSRKYGGSGLGLALSRKLARALGGDVSIRTDGVGLGCTFDIHFAAKIADDDDINTTTNGHEMARSFEPLNLNVLLVEDSPDNQIYIQHILTRHGARVDVAQNGEMGVNKAMEGNYDVILMDIQMPIMDGYQALNELKKRGYTKPIYALTAHAMSEERTKTHNAGYKGHLTKPINVNELIEVLSKHSH